MFLSDVSIKRPVFATMLMVALLTFGIVSYTRLAIDEYPDITYPTISVNTSRETSTFPSHWMAFMTDPPPYGSFPGCGPLRLSTGRGTAGA